MLNIYLYLYIAVLVFFTHSFFGNKRRRPAVSFVIESHRKQRQGCFSALYLYRFSAGFQVVSSLHGGTSKPNIAAWNWTNYSAVFPFLGPFPLLCFFSVRASSVKVLLFFWIWIWIEKMAEIDFVKVPKAELHTHLNGCVRDATLLELATVRHYVKLYALRKARRAHCSSSWRLISLCYSCTGSLNSSFAGNA